MTPGKIASLFVAAGYLAAAWLMPRGGADRVVHCALAVLMPLPFIWFSEAFGNYVGPAPWGMINRPTPGAFVAILGWILLLVCPVVVIALSS
jgi:hypothetical protein